MKRRVAIVRHSYYPSELNVKREAEALLGDGFDVEVLCLRGEGEAPSEMVAGVEVRRLPVRHRRASVARYLFEYAAFFLLASFTLAWSHLRRPYQAIQVNTMPDWLVFSTLIPRITGAKIVVHMHEPMPELWKTEFSGRASSGLILWFIRRTEQWGMRYAHKVLTVTEDLKARFVERGASAEKITVILNVPDDRIFNPGVLEKLPAREGGEDEFQLVSHGALEERYGIWTIVDAVEQVRSDVPGIRLVLMGKGELESELVRRIAERSLEPHVRFLGWIDFEEMLARIGRADAGIVAQLENEYSRLIHTNKMYEYVALERPVLMARLEAVQTTFGNDSFLYFEPGDAADLARAIRELHGDARRRKDLVARAGAVYARHVWSLERLRYLEVYRNLLGL